MSKSGLLQVFVTSVSLCCRLLLAETPSKDAGTGLEGVISISPVQAGPIRPGVPDSKPLGHTEFVVTKDDKQVASFETDDKGHFKISLPPGHYSISRKGLKPGIGNYGPFEADVGAGEMKRIQWTIDSGIR